MAQRPSPTGLAQSPWFWIHAFAVFCLIVLVVRGDKIIDLRARRAQNAGMRAVVGGKANVDDANQDIEAEVGWLAGAYILFAVIAIGSWWQVWRKVLRPNFTRAKLAREQHERMRSDAPADQTEV